MVNGALHRHGLTAIREARGLKKSQLAKLARVSPSYLTELENGDKPGSPSIIKRLADALGVNVLALINPEVADQVVAELQTERVA